MTADPRTLSSGPATQGAVLPISEVFGPTLQGEGPFAGRLSWFVRLGGCNLSCSWCDTPYTWDGSRFDLRSEISMTPVTEVLAKLSEAPLVVLTGGEPLLHQQNAGWLELVETLHDRGCTVQVETNGTIRPSGATREFIDTFVVSPKLANAGPHRGRQNPALADGWSELARSGKAHLKVVCESVDDVAAATELGRHLDWPPRQVWAMPLGSSEATLGERWPVVASAAVVYGINATHRLHVLAWQDARGH